MSNLDAHRAVSPRSPERRTPLQTQQPRFWTGYHGTPGIAAFRAEEQFSAWLHAHRQLKNTDNDYAAGCRSFQLRLVMCVLAGWLFYWTIQPQLGILVAAGLAGLAMVMAAALVVAAEQRRRNGRIGARFQARQ